jgi:hypothetical protein
MLSPGTLAFSFSYVQNGTVLAYEVPSRPHGQATTEIQRLLANFCVNTANRTLQTWGETDLRDGAGGFVAPDCCLIPVGRPTPPIGTVAGDAYPTVVVEVGITQTIPQLHARAAVYFAAATNIRLYLAFKLYKNGAMLLLFYQRLNAAPLVPDAISFGRHNLHHTVVTSVNALIPATFTGVGRPGGVACNAAGIAMYQVQLPVAELYHNVAVPAGLPVNLTVDLFNIQSSVDNW